MDNFSKDLQFNMKALWPYVQGLSITDSELVSETPSHETINAYSDLDQGDYVSLNYPDSPIQDTYLRYKVMDYISKLTQQPLSSYPLDTHQNVQSILLYTHKGIRSLDPTQLHTVRAFLHSLQNPEISKLLAMTPSELSTIKQCSSSISEYYDDLNSVPESNDDARWVEKSKALRESF